jgi:uncharacterized lipoprotein YajG
VWKKLAPLAAPLVLAACQATTPTAVTDTSCLAFEPITYSRKDTVMTAQQIREHNAAFQSLCPK